ncbi:N-acetyltransferase [Alsobacter soli]|uniref:N-acetyltransferase n=1 Tax=Alsobacter soli TaxID=2109933 RepID=A0A2T1HV86_9HYPH|nr:GNAT family N-acetyltransferase [Alsobacter soli]PSC05583.1 N-acetyltransferase [Alsobacter soli]
MSPAQPPIRDAAPCDAAAIARLHNALWHETYAVLAPPEVRQAMTEEIRLERWRALLGGPGPHAALVAGSGPDLAGFALLGPPTEAIFGGRCEVKHLFVRRDRQGEGLGRRLMAEAAHRAVHFGFSGLGLGVVDGNDGAIAFYAALGGVRAAPTSTPAHAGGQEIGCSPGTISAV